LTHLECFGKQCSGLVLAHIVWEEEILSNSFVYPHCIVAAHLPYKCRLD